MMDIGKQRTTGAPHPVDVHVGARITMARKIKLMSQTQLGEAIGVTFQQVQKYERGTNRVSASALFAIMQVLNLPAAYFFEGLANDYIGESVSPPEEDLSSDVYGFIQSKQGLKIVQAYLKAPPSVRRAFMVLLGKYS